jgi:hypothetical protein
MWRFLAVGLLVSIKPLATTSNNPTPTDTPWATWFIDPVFGNAVG